MARKGTTGSNDFFASLVANAIDFLENSVTELQKHPKYSVINFCSGLEIFLKARLLLEHWSLLDIKPENAILEKFKGGKFISVSLREALKRLRNVAGEEFTKEEEQCFNQVREHRNQLVHFFHPAYAQKPDDTLLQAIAIEQCKAWFYLHRLLTIRWSEHFKKHQKEIEQLHAKMHEHRAFLKAKFEALTPEIDKEIGQGHEYIVCESCGYGAARKEIEEVPFLKFQCRICNTSNSFLRVPCPECQKPIEVRDMGEGSCGTVDCEGEINLGYLLDEYGPLEDPKEPSELAYCSYCEHFEPTVIPLGDRYLCLWCIDLHRSTDNCEWCNSNIASFDPDGSYLYGCFICDGGLVKQDNS